VLEAHDAPKRAYEVYEAVLRILQAAAPPGRGGGGGGAERMRAVAVACRLGEMAEEYGLPLEEEERWRSWAVTELLRVVGKQGDGDGEEGTAAAAAVGGSVDVDVLGELDLPPWVRSEDLGAPIEALGAFYARTGNVE
jgi:hypothetical protein